MNRIQVMQTSICIVEVGNSVCAAETPSLPAFAVTSTIKSLEKYLKVRLLNRTTRQVSLIPEGLQHLVQYREILAFIGHSEFGLSEFVTRPQGYLRADMPAGIAHLIVMPHLSGFHRRYPNIYLTTGVNDRQVDLIQEGVDCVICMGELNDSSPVARPLGHSRWVTCTPSYYFRKYGMPPSPKALSKHRAVHCFSDRARRADESRLVRHGEIPSVPVGGNATVNETGLYIRMCLTDFGLIQPTENIVADHLQEGRPVGVLTD